MGVLLRSSSNDEEPGRVWMALLEQHSPSSPPVFHSLRRFMDAISLTAPTTGLPHKIPKIPQKKNSKYWKYYQEMPPTTLQNTPKNQLLKYLKSTRKITSNPPKTNEKLTHNTVYWKYSPHQKKNTSTS